MPQTDPNGHAASRTSRRIVVLATLDTKPDEARFVAECIRRRGHEPWLVDMGLRGKPPFEGDVSREEIARAAGQPTFAALSALSKTEAMEAVGKGAGVLVAAMVDRGEAHAIVGIGGGHGTWLCTAAMKTLPIGFPKLMVSTVAGRADSADITFMPSIADIAGLNSLLGPILANAACAISGMAEGVEVTLRRDRPTIGMTMFGVTTRGGTLVREFLEEAGCEVVVFHANGNGGATMEELIRQGRFVGVLDWTTSEATDEIVGGACTAGPRRLEAAGALGIPQVVIPGAVDVVNIPGGPLPRKWARRVLHWHTPTARLLRANVRENRAIGAWIGEKLSRATGPVRVLIPTGASPSTTRPRTRRSWPGCAARCGRT